MPKTYTAAGSATAGDVYTASAHNIIVTDVNNLIVPAVLRLERGATQSIANNTDTFISWPTEVFDNDACYTATSDTVTIQTTGVYQCNVSVAFAANSSGIRVIAICKNPSSATDLNSRIAQTQVGPPSTGETWISTSAIASFTAGDTLKAAVFQSSGVSLNIGNSSLPAATHLSVAWVGRTS